MTNYPNTTEMSMVISHGLFVVTMKNTTWRSDETLFRANIFKWFLVIALRNSCFCNYNAIMITFVMYNCAVTITVTFVLHYGAPVSVTLDKKSRINLHLSLAVISCCALTICPHHVHFLYRHTVSHNVTQCHTSCDFDVTSFRLEIIYHITWLFPHLTNHLLLFWKRR